ncbi:hypothetical protein H257_05642, partial [Aphanomyces astaci]
ALPILRLLVLLVTSRVTIYCTMYVHHLSGSDSESTQKNDCLASHEGRTTPRPHQRVKVSCPCCNAFENIQNLCGIPGVQLQGPSPPIHSRDCRCGVLPHCSAVHTWESLADSTFKMLMLVLAILGHLFSFTTGYAAGYPPRCRKQLRMNPPCVNTAMRFAWRKVSAMNCSASAARSNPSCRDSPGSFGASGPSLRA